METCPFQHFTFIHISLLFVFSLFSFTGCKIPLSETQLFADIFRIHHYTNGFISSKRETISCHPFRVGFFLPGAKEKKKINHKRKMLLDFHDLMLCFSSFACFFSYLFLHSSVASRQEIWIRWPKKSTQKQEGKKKRCEIRLKWWWKCHHCWDASLEFVDDNSTTILWTFFSSFSSLLFSHFL